MSTVSLPPPAIVPDSIVLRPDSAGLRMSPREFDDIGEDEYERGFRYELVDGVIVVSPAPGDGQSDPVDLLGYLLNAYRFEHPSGSVLSKTAPERYIRVEGGRRLADRVIWVGFGRRPVSRYDVPTIAIEFVSAGKRNWIRDYVTKRDEYLVAGVTEYWIFDRFERTLTVYTATESEFTEAVFQEDDNYRTDLLPGFELPIKRILDEAIAAAEAEEEARQQEDQP